MSLPAGGYTAPRLAELREALRDAVRVELGDQVNLDEGTLLGNLVDIVAARMDEMGEGLQGVYDAFDERSATDIYLDNLASLVGLIREAATRSTVVLALTTLGAVPVVVPAGSIVADAEGVQWITAALATIPAAGSVDVDASPADTGPIPALAGILTEIVTPVAGWDSVTNAAAATEGQDRETDSELRSRRRRSLQIIGAAAPNAIRARVLALAGTDACIVVDNKTDSDVVVGSITLTPHSCAVVVSPNGLSAAVKADVAEAIWRTAAAGIATCRMVANDAGAGGGVTANVIDVVGVTQTVHFSTATDHAVTCSVTVVDGVVPALDADIQAAVVACVATLTVGEDPKLLPVYEALGELDGIDDVTALSFGGTPVATFGQAELTIPITIIHT